MKTSFQGTCVPAGNRKLTSGRKQYVELCVKFCVRVGTDRAQGKRNVNNNI